jgi:hypothetical protein
VKPKWSVEAAGAIVQLQVERTLEGTAGMTEWNNRNSYMLSHIGGGIIWPEIGLFSSEEDAEAECVRRNGELETEKVK